MPAIWRDGGMDGSRTVPVGVPWWWRTSKRDHSSRSASHVRGLAPHRWVCGPAARRRTRRRSSSASTTPIAIRATHVTSREHLDLDTAVEKGLHPISGTTPRAGLLTAATLGETPLGAGRRRPDLDSPRTSTSAGLPRYRAQAQFTADHVERVRTALPGRPGGDECRHVRQGPPSRLPSRPPAVGLRLPQAAAANSGKPRMFR